VARLALWKGLGRRGEEPLLPRGARCQVEEDLEPPPPVLMGGWGEDGDWVKTSREGRAGRGGWRKGTRTAVGGAVTTDSVEDVPWTGRWSWMPGHMGR